MVEQLHDTDLGILIGLAYQQFKDELHAELARGGFDDIRDVYGYVFRALAAEELSQRDLAIRFGMTDQGMAKIVGEMEQRGYLERRTDRLDARIKRLRLARRGRDALAAARRFHATFERRLVRQTGGASVRKLRQMLQAIATTPEPHDLAQARLRPI